MNPDARVWTAVAFLFGAIIGSFANVCIFRLPRELSITNGRSKCGECGSQVAAYDNVPILSYVWLLGRCRNCGAPFSLQYPIVELIIGAIAALLYARQGLSFYSLYVFALATALVIVSAIDFEFRIIPDSISITGTWIGLVAAGLTQWLGYPWPVSFWEAFAGAAVGGGLLWGVGSLYEWVTGREGIGFGDVKLLALFGAHAGVTGVLASLFVGSLFGSVAGMGLMVFRGKGSRTPIPFGPFLCAGLLVYAWFGGAVVEWPMKMLGLGIFRGN